MWLFLLHYFTIYRRNLNYPGDYSLQILQPKAAGRDERRLNLLARVSAGWKGSKSEGITPWQLCEWANEPIKWSQFHDREVWNFCLWIFKALNLSHWFRVNVENIFPRWIHQIHLSSRTLWWSFRNFRRSRPHGSEVGCDLFFAVSSASDADALSNSHAQFRPLSCYEMSLNDSIKE